MGYRLGFLFEPVGSKARMAPMATGKGFRFLGGGRRHAVGSGQGWNMSDGKELQ